MNNWCLIGPFVCLARSGFATEASPLRFFFKANERMPVTVTIVICASFLKIAGPKFLYRAVFVRIGTTGPGHIELYTGQVRNEVLLSTVSDHFIDVIVGDFRARKVMLPGVLNHVRKEDQNFLPFLLVEDRLGNIQGIENLRPWRPFLPG